MTKKLKKLWIRLRKVNKKIRVKRGKGLKTPVAAAERKRLKRKIAFLTEQADPAINADGFAVYTAPSGEKTLVAGWMVGAAPGPDGRTIDWLARYRKHGWDGELSSGGRSPEYSESLCRAMCGAPSCPGSCAGRASNHAGSDGPGKKGNDSWGAIDVFPDYVRFERIGFEIDSPLWNDLDERDPVHFSVTGR